MDDIRFLYPLSKILPDGFEYSKPILFGYDRNKKNGFEDNEVHDIDYSNSQKDFDVEIHERISA